MTQVYDWNKLSEKKRDKLLNVRNFVFIPGPIDLSKNRVKQIISKVKVLRLRSKQAVKQQNKVLFGCLKDEWIPGLEGSLQFSPLKLDKLKKLAEKLDFDIIKHFHKDTKYIVKEIKPKRVIFINGSWNGPIHYKSMYWKALDSGAKVRLVSPFAAEKEAKKFTKEIEEQYEKEKLYLKKKKYSDAEIFQIIKQRKKQSWDWVGLIAAALVKDGKILTLAHNRVLPYQAYQMHFGSIREKKQIPSQEMIETHLTNHAECEILEQVRRDKISLKNTWLYLNIFPCPVCAKMLSRTEIEGIVYSQDHNLGNDIGYKTLQACGKKLRRVVV